jgi:alanine racemase
MFAQASLRTWVEIDRSAILYNITKFRSLITHPTKLMAVVKSNAYGHNIHDFSRLVLGAGADCLGVDSITEAIPLRKEGITQPILVLGYTLPENYSLARAADVSITISSIEQLRHLLATDFSKSWQFSPVRIHLKVDTGMCRQGMLYDVDHTEALNLILKGIRQEKFILEGLYTHLASAKAPGVSGETETQLSEFRRWREFFKAHSISIPIVHAAASAGTLLYPSSHFDMVRIGMGCYGYFPSAGIARHFKNRVSLRPVLSWYSIVSEVKSVSAGMKVGYDGTHILKRDSVLAVIPIGYWHGIGRVFSNNGHVIINGQVARILGLVSMDMITVDITDIPDVSMGTRVTLIGKDGNISVSAEDLGRLSGTTAYEILTRLNPLIERIVVS